MTERRTRRRRARRATIGLVALAAAATAVVPAPRPAAAATDEDPAAAAAAADGVRPAPLALADCVVRAADGPHVRAALERAELAGARLMERRWDWFPDLTFTGYFSYAPGSGGDVQDPRGDILSDWGPLVRLELSGDLPLYTFGRMAADEAAAAHEHDAARARVTGAVQDMTLRVRRLWYERLAAIARVDAFDAALEELDGIAARLRELEEEDDVDFDPVDPVRLRVRRSDVVIRRSAAVRARLDAEAELRSLLGVDRDAPVTFAAPDLEPVIRAPGPVGEYVDIARTLNPTVRGRREEELAARDRARARDRAFLPEVLLVGKVRYGYAGAYTPQPSPFADDTANSWEAAALLTLRVPLDVPAMIAARDEADAALARSAWRRRGEADRVALRVTQRYHEVRDLAALLPGREDAARAARGWYGAQSSTWSLGSVSLNDVLGALAQHVDRRIAVIDTIRDLDVAVAELSRVVGVDVAALRSARLPEAEDGGERPTLPPGVEIPADLPPAVRERLLERLRTR